MPPTAKPAAPPAAAAAGKATIPATPKPGGTATPPAPAKPAQHPADAPPAAAKPAGGNGAPPAADKANGTPLAADKAAAPATVDFKCPQCDEAIKIDIALAGKMAPCPECSRIVRVPLPTKKQPTDWRNVATGPSLARTDTEPVPDGAWGSATVSTVSRQSLIEAEATSTREPWTRWQKIKWSGIAAAAILLVVGTVMGVMNFWSGSLQDKALREAMRDIAHLENLSAAEIHRAVGEYSIRAGGDAMPIGRQHLQAAVAKLATTNPGGERDALLTGIAVLQVDLIPDEEQIKKAQIRKEAEQEQERAFRELQRTLSLIAAPEARAAALRQVTQKLLPKKLVEQAPRLLGGGDGDQGETAVLGLELWRLGQTQPATAMADLLLRNRAQARDKEPKDKDNKQKGKPPSPALVALCVVLKKPQEEMDKLKPAFGDQFSWHLGQIQGLAMLGQFEKARGEKDNLKDLDLLYAFAVLAEAGADKNATSNTDLDDAAKWVEGQDKPAQWSAAPNRPDPSWVLFRLTQLAIAAGKPDLASTFAAAVPDQQVLGRAKLEILRDKLAKSPGMAEESWANDLEMPALGPAKEAIARHNAKIQGGDILKVIARWPEDNLRPFGFVGAALGLQEK